LLNVKPLVHHATSGLENVNGWTWTLCWHRYQPRNYSSVWCWCVCVCVSTGVRLSFRNLAFSWYRHSGLLNHICFISETTRHLHFSDSLINICSPCPVSPWLDLPTVYCVIDFWCHFGSLVSKYHARYVIATCSTVRQTFSVFLCCFCSHKSHKHAVEHHLTAASEVKTSDIL
jgi:hypothetical protein